MKDRGLPPRGQSPRSMYELKTICSWSDEDNGSFEGFVICRKCMNELYEKKLKRRDKK